MKVIANTTKIRSALTILQQVYMWDDRAKLIAVPDFDCLAFYFLGSAAEIKVILPVESSDFHDEVIANSNSYLIKNPRRFIQNLETCVKKQNEGLAISMTDAVMSFEIPGDFIKYEDVLIHGEFAGFESPDDYDITVSAFSFLSAINSFEDEIYSTDFRFGDILYVINYDKVFVALKNGDFLGVSEISAHYYKSYQKVICVPVWVWRRIHDLINSVRRADLYEAYISYSNDKLLIQFDTIEICVDAFEIEIPSDIFWLRKFQFRYDVWLRTSAVLRAIKALHAFVGNTNFALDISTDPNGSALNCSVSAVGGSATVSIPVDDFRQPIAFSIPYTNAMAIFNALYKNRVSDFYCAITGGKLFVWDDEFKLYYFYSIRALGE
jgi:hypothetical protein